MTETNAEISITAASFSGAVFFTSLFRRIPGSSLWAGSFGLCLNQQRGNRVPGKRIPFGVRLFY